MDIRASRAFHGSNRAQFLTVDITTKIPLECAALSDLKEAVSKDLTNVREGGMHVDPLMSEVGSAK